MNLSLYNFRKKNIPKMHKNCIKNLSENCYKNLWHNKIDKTGLLKFSDFSCLTGARLIYLIYDLEQTGCLTSNPCTYKHNL